MTEQEAATGRANRPRLPSRRPSQRPDLLTLMMFCLSLSSFFPLPSPDPNLLADLPFLLLFVPRPPFYISLASPYLISFLLCLCNHFTATRCSPNQYFPVGLSSSFLLLAIVYLSPMFLSFVLSSYLTPNSLFFLLIIICLLLLTFSSRFLSLH